MTASATAVLTRAAMSPENVAAKVAVTAELMPNYRIATPFTIGAQALIATAFVPAKNQSEVFSVGNGGRVYHVFPDAASDTGWSSQDLNFPTQAQCIAAGLLPQGGLVVYVIDANFDVYSRNMGTGDDSGAAWQVFPKIIGQLSPASQPGYVRTINGVYELSVLYDHANIPRPAVVVTDNADEGLLWQALPSLAGWQIHKQPAQGGTRAGFVATPDGAGAPGLFSCAGPDGYLTLLTDINGYAPLVQGLWFPATTVRSSAGFDEVIATTGEVQTRSQAAYFALDASTGQFTPSVIGDPSTFRSFYGSVVASRKANGLMDVFCLNDGKNLLHVRQDPAQQGGWSETLQVSALQFSNIVACSQQPNLTALFAVTTDGRLFHIWQDEDTAGVSDDTVWHVDPVEVAAGGVLEENQTYTARIDFYDAQSTPVPNAKVTVYSDDTVWLEINNASCCVDRTHPWQGSANAMGQLIVTVQRDTIGIPALALWTPGMPDKDRITLDLSAPIQSKLAGSSGEGIIADDLKKAQVKDDDGRASPLLTGSAMADSDSLSHVVLAINRSVGMLTNAGSHQAADRSDWFHALNDARITRYVPNCPPGPLRRLHRPSISDQAWRMSFAGGKLTTADLTADAAQQLVAQARTLAPLSSKWDWDWGDLFDAVRSGLATVYDVVVQPLVDKVQATITVVVNTIHHVVEAVIELAEQVFDLVQEAFRKLQVKFTELCAWLGEKLGWSGVLRTQQAFISLFNGLLDYSVLAVPTLEGFITDKIADLERTLVQQIEGYIPRLVGTDPSILVFNCNIPR